MVKQMNFCKCPFWKNTDENGGAMNEAIKNCHDDTVVVHSHTKKNGRIWGIMKPNNLLNHLTKNNGFYEVITKMPHKVYFDIDKKGTADDTYLNHIKNIIIKFFPDANMAISGSITETKTSYHIVLQNYIIHNTDEREYVKHLTKHICENIDDSFDWKVYTKNRNMKCIYQSKLDGRVQEIIENDDFKSHLITCFISDYALPFQELPAKIKEEVMIEKSHKSFDIGLLPKMILQTPENFNVETATPEAILKITPLNKNFDHNYTHLIARFCYYNQISFEAFLSWLENKHNPMRNDIIIKWKGHFEKLDKFPPVDKNKMISILQAFYPSLKKDVHYRNFCDTFVLPQNHIEKIETINQDHFDCPEKYKIFNVGMGGGKTAQTIQYLKTKRNFLWIAPNKALATNTLKRFENEDIDVSYYEKYSTMKKKEGKLKELEKLIICLNSIHYLDDTTYDVLVIDEPETLFDKFLNDFLEQGTKKLKKKIWEIFVNIFRRAQYVILLDAFITTKTIHLINKIDNAPYKIYERVNEPYTRKIHFVNHTETMLDDIRQKLKNGSKVCIFYPYKKDIGENIFGMNTIHNMLEIQTGKKGIVYNADVDDKTKKTLKDVNNNWDKVDYVITNNIITCGLNYENNDYDYKYIFIAQHNSPRDMIQFSYRLRNLSSGIIKVCYLGKMNQSSTWINDCEHINCPIYKSLYKDILIEKKAPLRRSFQLFCVKAHYKLQTDKFKVNEAVAGEIKKLCMDNKVYFSYDNIPDIDYGTAEYFETKCFAQEATMIDKFSLNKYYFKKSFIQDENNKEIDYNLKDIWDENFIFFFKRCGEILMDKNNLFNSIAEYNNLKNVFPVNVKKTKLNNELTQQIFKEFSFKYISTSSSSNKILKEIYNTYFCKNIISTKLDENKNATYEVDETVFSYLDFAKKYLLLNKETYLTYNDLQASNEEEEKFIEV